MLTTKRNALVVPALAGIAIIPPNGSVQLNVARFSKSKAGGGECFLTEQSGHSANSFASARHQLGKLSDIRRFLTATSGQRWTLLKGSTTNDMQRFIKILLSFGITNGRCGDV